MKINHLTHNQIDFKLWDECISASKNGLIYGKSWFLDLVSPGWEALVTDDYKIIFPLPIKRKYKIPYLVQPKMTQQLGLFSNNEINETDIKAFIKKMPSYSYEINLNEENVYSEAMEQPNYILELDRTYEEIYRLFTKNTVRNIKNAEKNSLSFTNQLTTDDFIEFVNTNKKGFFKMNIKILYKILATGVLNNEIKLYGSINQEGNLVAVACFSVFKKRIINLLPVSNEEGKLKSAMFLIINEIIKKYSGVEGNVLDFEGSKIEGIARFYKGFGASYKPFYTIKNLRPSFLVGKIIKS